MFFLRDILFVSLTAIYLLVIVIFVGQINIISSVGCIILYIVYVLVVVI